MNSSIRESVRHCYPLFPMRPASPREMISVSFEIPAESCPVKQPDCISCANAKLKPHLIYSNGDPRMLTLCTSAVLLLSSSVLVGDDAGFQVR